MDMDELLDHVMALPEPWHIVGVDLDRAKKRVDVRVAFGSSSASCPECGELSGKYDAKERRWRHLDLIDHQTWVVCEIPRVKCATHGVHRIQVPWADGWARFTAQFECSVIDWLKEASVSAVARNFGLNWGQVQGIQQRAVSRGMARRGPITASRIGVDETSFQKRHEYVTAVTNLDGSVVLYVADGNGKGSLDGFFEGLSEDQLNAIEVVAMDMHKPFIASAGYHVTGLIEKLCFDRFHVAQHFSMAMDQTRRAESKRLAAEGDDSLKRTRYLWLKNEDNLSSEMRIQLVGLLEIAGPVGEVWAIKEAASKLWDYDSRSSAQAAWISLCEVARDLEIPALTRVADMVLRHMLGIVNAIVHKVSNAVSESVNSRIQALKRRANGYRNRARFRDAIMFHLGGLDLYQRQLIHTTP